MNHTPLVSVLMPVYNTNAEDLENSIKSILNQTYTNFEFLIINDCSTNNAEEVILSYDDKRIKYVKNTENLKITSTLNKGINLSKGNYIARLDSDDFCTNTRLEKQIEYMGKNPSIGVLGSFYTRIPSNQKIILPYLPSDVKIFTRYVKGCILHSSAVIRKPILTQNNLLYDSNCLHAEDHKLWSDMSRFCDIAVLPEFLTFYKDSEQGISRTNTAWQNKMVTVILLDNIIKDFAEHKNYFYTLLVKYIQNKPITEEEYINITKLLNEVCTKLENQISPQYKNEIRKYIEPLANFFVKNSNFY